MFQVVLISLLLAVLSSAALALEPDDLSSQLFLLPLDKQCAINFGKDRSYGPVYAPEFVFYDGVRCKGQFSEKATTAFVVGESRTLKDVADAAKSVGDVVTLQAQVLETGLRHDRMGKMKRRNGVVQCGERSLREILFLGPKRNGAVEARGARFDVRKGNLYAFVDDVRTSSRRNVVHAKELRAVDQGGLCFFKGALTSDDFGDDVGVDQEEAASGTSIGVDRAGRIAGGVLGVAILAIVLYGIVFVMFRKVRAGEESGTHDEP